MSLISLESAKISLESVNASPTDYSVWSRARGGAGREGTAGAGGRKRYAPAAAYSDGSISNISEAPEVKMNMYIKGDWN